MHVYIFSWVGSTAFVIFSKDCPMTYKTLRTHRLEHAFSMGVVSPPPHTQEVKNWFRDGNLRYYNVYVLPKGHSTYAETQNIGDIKISCIGGGQLGKNVRGCTKTKKQTDVQTEVPKCTSNTSSVQRIAEY